MSKATTTLNPNRPHPTSRLARTHADLVAALAVLPPQRISSAATAADLQSRARHGRQVFDAVTAYLGSLADDTLDHLATDANTDWSGVDLVIWDSYDDPDWDVVAALERAGYRFDLRAAA